MIGRDENGLRSETVRRANLSAILRLLHERGPQSRSALVTRTGLTRSAIRALIGELAAAGFVAEAPSRPMGLPGRPSPVVRVVTDRSVVLALEIAVDSLAVAVVGLGGVVHERIRTERSHDRSDVDEVVADLVELTRRVRARRSRGELPIGIGVAVVGVVRRADGLVRMAPNLGWRDEPLGDRLRAALGIDAPIAIANEADLGALAELRRGAAIGAADVIFLSGEVGVGGGIVVDGRPLAGVAGYAGEVGHLVVNPDGRPCRCGSIGCWETEVGEDALLEAAGGTAGGGRREVDAVMERASQGEPLALAAFAQVGRWLGIGLAGLVNVFDPEVIVLGGRYARIHPHVIGPLKMELDRRALPASRGLVRIVTATLRGDAPLIGAAELAIEPLLADPAAWIGPRATLAELATA